MAGVHDIGGRHTAEPIDRSGHELADWERQTDALYRALSEKALVYSDELRRCNEALSPQQYESLSYYERWSASLEALLTEKFILTTQEIDQKVLELG